MEKQFIPQYAVSLVDQITEFLSNEVIEGRLKSGQRLVENELRRKFGVSRAPIRESLRILESNGLLINIPRKGRFVRGIDKKSVEENFLVRASLESLAARLAIPNLRPEDIEGMKVALSRMTEALRKKDFKSYFKYHFDYHDIFVYASKMDTLIRILENVRRHAIWIRIVYLSGSVQKYFNDTTDVHRQILDLFIKKDADGVEALVKKHLLAAIEEASQFLKSKNEEVLER